MKVSNATILVSKHDGATLLAEIKMETNKEDGLKGSIETRLAAREREQEALRKAIFHRLAEREAALRCFFYVVLI